MSECVREYYIKNSEVLRCEEFSDEFVSKGTSLYEVIRIVDSVPIFLERHLERLNNSAKLAESELWMNNDEIYAELLRLIQANKVSEGNIKIVFNYRNNNSDENAFLAYFIKHHYPSEEQYISGVPTILINIERNNPNAKIINNEFRRITDEKIKNSGAFEAILVDRKRFITEGSRSNIFMVANDTVITAPLKAVLPGITREVIIEICMKENIKFMEKKVEESEICNLDALFITGTSPKVLPINKVDDIVFASSTNNVVQKIMEKYNIIIDDYIKANKKN